MCAFLKAIYQKLTRLCIIGLALGTLVPSDFFFDEFAHADPSDDPALKRWIPALDRYLNSKEVRSVDPPGPAKGDCPTCMISASHSPRPSPNTVSKTIPEPVNAPAFSMPPSLSMFVLFPSFKTHSITKSSISGSVTTGNNWTPSVYVIPKDQAGGDVYFVCPDGNCPIIDDLDGKTPLRFVNISEEDFKKNAKVFHADGVVRQFKIHLDQALRKNQSVSLEVGLTQLVTGKDGLGPSDSFIEWFHTKILGPKNVDPFSRSLYPYEQAEIYFRDGEGKEHRMRAGDLGGTLKIEYVKSIDFVDEKKNRLMTVSFGGMVGGAVGSKGREFNPDIQIGVFASGAVNKGFTKNRTLTVAFGGSITKVDAIKTGPEAPNMGLKPYRKEINFLLAGTKTTPNGKLKVTLGGQIDFHSVLLDKDKYTFKYPAINESDVVNGEGPYRGSKTIKQYFMSNNINMQPFIRFEFPYKKYSFELSGIEDSSPTSNSVDFGYSLKFRVLLEKFNKGARIPAGF